MPFVLLVRHGRTGANAAGILAGWSAGVGLDEVGREQAERLALRLEGVPIHQVVSSPLERTRATAQALLRGHSQAPEVQVDPDIGEAHYGAWTGRRLEELRTDPLWQQVQHHPSGVTFPADARYRHESMAQMQRRAVAAVRHWDSAAAQHDPAAVTVVVSHGDVIKAILADAMAAPLDEFQRLVVDPGSVSVLHLQPDRPFVLRVNDTGTDPLDLSAQILSTQQGQRQETVGGGAGVPEKTDPQRLQ